MKSIFFSLLVLSFFAFTAADARERSVGPQLTIEAPLATTFNVRRPNGVRTIQYINRRGLVTTTQWPLMFRISSGDAVGFVAKRSLNSEREALVLSDPDNCFNLFSLVEDLMINSFDFTCEGLGEDEKYIEVQTEKHDTFGEFDNDTTGNDAIQGTPD